MYLSGKPMTASPSTPHEQKPETVQAGESSDATREPIIPLGFLFRPGAGHRLAVPGSTSWAGLLELGTAIEIVLADHYPLVHSLSSRIRLGDGVAGDWNVISVSWHKSPGHFAPFPLTTQPHLFPMTARLLEVVAVDSAGSPLVRRQALLSDVFAARLNACAAKERANKFHGGVPAWHEAMILRKSARDIENCIPTAKRDADYCLASFVE